MKYATLLPAMTSHNKVQADATSRAMVTELLTAVGQKRSNVTTAFSARCWIRCTSSRCKCADG